MTNPNRQNPLRNLHSPEKAPLKNSQQLWTRNLFLVHSLALEPKMPLRLSKVDSPQLFQGNLLSKAQTIYKISIISSSLIWTRSFHSRKIETLHSYGGPTSCRRWTNSLIKHCFRQKLISPQDLWVLNLQWPIGTIIQILN